MIFQNQIQPCQHPAEDPSGDPNQVQDKIYIKKKNLLRYNSGFPGGSVVKKLAATQEPKEMQVRSLGGEDPLEEGMETHSSILAWSIPWTEEPGGLQSMGSWRVGHDWSNLAHTYERYNWDTIKSIQSIQFPDFNISRVLNIHNNLILITPKRNLEPMSSLSSCPLSPVPGNG